MYILTYIQTLHRTQYLTCVHRMTWRRRASRWWWWDDQCTFAMILVELDIQDAPYLQHMIWIDIIIVLTITIII